VQATAADLGAADRLEESATVNCDVVNTSDWSELLGIPPRPSPSHLPDLSAFTVLVLRGRRELLPLLMPAGVGATGLSAVLFYVSKVQLGTSAVGASRMYGSTSRSWCSRSSRDEPTRPTVAAESLPRRWWR